MTTSEVNTTTYGITVNIYRVGRVVFLRMNGNASQALGGSATIYTIPSGYRPVVAFFFPSFINSTTTTTRGAAYIDGSVQINASIAKSASVQLAIMYVCAAY